MDVKAKKSPPDHWDTVKWEVLKKDLVSNNEGLFLRKHWPRGFYDLSGSQFEEFLQHCLIHFLENIEEAGDHFISDMAFSFPNITNGNVTIHKWGDFEMDQKFIHGALNNKKRIHSLPSILNRQTFYRWKKEIEYPSEKILNFLVISLNANYQSWNLYGVDRLDPGVILVEEIPLSGPGPLKARVFMGIQRYEVQLSNSISDAEQKDLNWYFDDYIYETYIAESRAKRCEKVILRVGQELFAYLFIRDGRDLFSEYIQSIGAYNKITIDILSVSNAFDRFNWEWLKEENASHPLISKGVIIYRRFHATQRKRVPTQPNNRLHLLMVTSRPKLDRDIPYNTIQKPMVESLQNSFFVHQGDNYDIQVDILRPGTYRTLFNHLSENPGKYHIIHFDMHGLVSDYPGLLEKKGKEGGLNFLSFRSFAPGEGIMDEIEPFEGTESFLLFEREKPGMADVVKAEEFAKMISMGGAPICIFGACQTALHNEQGDEINLAKIVSNQGADLVVAMRHSVTVDAARIFCSNLYGELRKDQPIEKSLNKARSKLILCKERLGRFGVRIRLEDWTIPIIYRNRKPDLNLSPSSGASEGNDTMSRKLPNKFDQESFGGTFIERDNDISLIERALLSRRPDGKYKSRLGVDGMLGEGKSTLFQYLAWWWEESNFARAVFYFSVGDPEFSFSKILDAIHAKLEMSTEYSPNNIAQILNSQRVILIFDGFDDVNGQGWTSFAPADEEALLEFLKMITPRSGEDGHFNTQSIMIARNKSTFPPGFIPDNQIISLQGLSERDSYKLIRALLNPTDESWNQLSDNHSFRRLVRLMNGNPLAIKKIMPQLKNHSSKELLKDFFGEEW